MSQKLFKLGFASLLLFSVTLSLPSQQAIAQRVEATIPEDALGTQGGMPWGGGKLPFSKIVEIQDGLVGTPVGRVIIDRHGVDNGEATYGIMKSPFSYPEPVKLVVISLWGSKIEGCFTELIFQWSPRGEASSKAIEPVMLEMGIDGQVVQLTPQNVEPKLYSFGYQYTRDKRAYSATWYMARQLFMMDTTIAEILSNAPTENIRARVTFADDSTFLFPIGKGTVQRWKDAYSFNPACQPME
jgi:hypothetical protein